MCNQVRKILILGGTKEAAALAANLIKEGHDVTTSLAGITKDPSHIEGKIRIGGFSKGVVSGAMGLAGFLEDGCFDQLIDATHPFAKQISENAKIAANISGISLKIVSRPPWIKQCGDLWAEVSSLEEAVNTIPKDAKVLLALGSKYIDIFESRYDVTFLVRMVDKPEFTLRLPKHTLILGKPNIKIEQEIAILIDHKITHIVCRNSGGTGAYAKIEAARALSIPVIIVGRTH